VSEAAPWHDHNAHDGGGFSRSSRALVEIVIASTVGTTIEWYDFFLYGTTAALVFPTVFFPTVDEAVGQILAFGTFTFGFIARPLGAVLFGYMGDRLGRKSTLVTTLLLMGLSTLLIGFLPTYDRIGSTAAVLLTFLRFVQGVGVGGEWGGAVLLPLESSHRGRRGFYASWPQAGVPLGLLISTGAVALCKSLLNAEDFLAWGWRIPFYFSGLLIVVGLVIRVRILESPLFRQLQATDQVARAPVREVVRGHWREILLVAGARISENSCFYLFSTYVIAYARDALHLEGQWILWVVMFAALLELVTIPLFGMLSDFWSRKNTYIAGCLFLTAFAFPYYALLAKGQLGWVVVAVVLSLPVGHAILYSVQAALIPELFGTRLRYSGASIGYQLATPIAGGLAPLIAASLSRMFPEQYWPLALYIILISVLSLICVCCVAETSTKDLQRL
jgi:metabolite-proton symporter